MEPPNLERPTEEVRAEVVRVPGLGAGLRLGDFVARLLPIGRTQYSLCTHPVSHEWVPTNGVTH